MTSVWQNTGRWELRPSWLRGIMIVWGEQRQAERSSSGLHYTFKYRWRRAQRQDLSEAQMKGGSL